MPDRATPETPLLSVEGLSIVVPSGFATEPLTAQLAPGELLALSGAGGSGKSLVCEVLAGIHRPGVTIEGAVRYLEPARVAWVPQDARLAALPTDPVERILSARARDPRRREWFEALRLGERLLPLPLRALSASERIRVLLVNALLGKPRILVLDGVTDRLDSGDISAIFTLLRRQRAEGVGLVVSSRRDLRSLSPSREANLGTGSLDEVAMPLLRRTTTRTPKPHEHPVLEVDRLVVRYERRRFLSPGPVVTPVDGASLFLRHGELLVLFGEAGSGKTTLLETIAGLRRPASGRIRVMGQDVTQARGRRLRTARRLVQLVFQDASAVLESSRTVGQHLAEAAQLGGRGARRGTPAEWLERLGLSPRLLGADADVLSASEAARVDFARSLAVGPAAILFDGPRTAAIRSDGGALASLIHAERDAGMSFLIATSDLDVARSTADRLAILHRGRIVEMGPAEAVLDKPQHPYTRALFAGHPPAPRDPVATLMGCHHAIDCPLKQERCTSREPALFALRSSPSTEGRHRVACFVTAEIPET